METAFRFEGVVKRYGRVEALRGLTLSAPRGSVIGFVGRNGAGKSTAIRCLVGLQQPSEGKVELLGENPWELDVPTKQRLGYLSERGVPYPWATPEELIRFCSPLYPRWDDEMERSLLERFGIDRKRKLKTLSLGQQRAVGLLLAVCPHPEVLVLDEPAANLDAVVRRGFLEQVLALVREEGRTVLFSSHILSDVERVADRIAVLHQGRILLDRQMDALKEQVRRVRLVFEGEPPAAVEIPGVLRLRRSGKELLATVDHFEELLPARLKQGTGASFVESLPLGLEELFIDLTNDVAGTA